MYANLVFVFVKSGKIDAGKFVKLIQMTYLVVSNE